MRIIEGVFYSPFMIFIKGAVDKSDDQIIKMLGFDRYEAVDKERWNTRELFVYITRVGNWLHIMDSLTYNLWHDSDIRSSIEELASKYDIYYCSIGDTSYDYGFTYYKNGELLRKLIVSYPNYKGPIVEENFGTHLKGESQEIVLKDERKEVLSIARELGIDLNHRIENITQYILYR